MDQHEKTKKPPVSEQRIKEIAAIKDEDIDYSDIPELDDDFWKNAKVMPPRTRTEPTK